MDGFRVEPGALEQAASSLAEVLHGRDGSALRGLCGPVQRYGHAGVHEALQASCSRWAAGLDLLAGDGAAIASGLRRAAAGYRAADDGVATRPASVADLALADPVAPVPGRPEEIDDDARALRLQADAAARAGDALGGVDLSGGSAARRQSGGGGGGAADGHRPGDEEDDPRHARAGRPWTRAVPEARRPGGEHAALHVHFHPDRCAEGSGP